jgi:uncharacterized membrane protein
MIASIGSLLRGALYGAGAMYFLDPVRGRRRRAEVGRQAVRLVHESETLWNKGCRDLMNRGTGLTAEARRLLVAGSADDHVVTERVRSVLGHHVVDARGVEVATLDGHVTLRGTVRPGEPERLIPAIEAIPGVREVRSGLTTTGVPVGPPCAESCLAPGPRLLMTAGGALLLLNGLARRGFGPTLLGTLGLGMCVRGLTDKPGRLVGVGHDRAIDVQRSVRIGAPVEKVFEFVSDVEQSGRFLPEVVDVADLGQGRVRWTVQGPAGIGRFECEEQLIESVENERLVWGSVPDAPLRYVGEARFRPDGDATRLDVRLSYEPPGGLLTHSVASLLGVDPKTQLDRCLNRIKRYLEEGAVPHGVSDRKVNQHRG